MAPELVKTRVLETPGDPYFRWQSVSFLRVETPKGKTCQSMGTGSAILLEAAKHAEAFKGASVFEAFGMHGQRWPYVAVCGRS